ncbi:DUF4179 domain-containing protein [Paenibacillus methanolicus]|uniref:Uncharacterized protein DUF4179 n=1 Tax=Paenibacillus methanolicus TaxID=582686 RepID=A0A5S5CH60_9BACL|nr:DUF4179 domain-containing protein [Paenibacillus methanolicus]TYP79126.1 uncharacterized protein DUF4179 [Paenibacillus methanolicus]
MAASNIEQELKKAGNDQPAMSPLVRARLDETYANIGGIQPKRKGRTRWTGLRLIAASTAAAGVLGIGVLATAFASPAMADSIRSLPVIGSIFSTLQGDSGLRAAGEQGLFATVNREVSHEDVKLKVTDTIYDGTRVAFLLTVEAPNLKDGVYDNGRKTVKLGSAIDQVVLKGENDGGAISSLSGAGGLFYGGAGKEHPNTLVFEQVLPYANPNDAPDVFEASVTIKLDGIDHEFAFDIPFRKTMQASIEITPDAKSENGDYRFQVANVGVTPVTTRILTELEYKHAFVLTNKEERRLTRVGIAVFDDQGRRLTALNGEGIVEGNKIVYDRRFATTPGMSDYLTVKPFKIEDDFAEEVKESQYLKGLEVKIELPSAD